MRIKLVFIFGLLLALVGIFRELVVYTFRHVSLSFNLLMLVLTLVFAVLAVWYYAREESRLMSLAGFIKYYMHLAVIMLASSALHVLFEYTLFQYIDPGYAYELEDMQYQHMVRHRQRRGLPADPPKSEQEIRDQYSFAGIEARYHAQYVIGLILALLLYLPALFFHYLHFSQEDSASQASSTDSTG